MGYSTNISTKPYYFSDESYVGKGFLTLGITIQTLCCSILLTPPASNEEDISYKASILSIAFVATPLIILGRHLCSKPSHILEIQRVFQKANKELNSKMYAHANSKIFKDVTFLCRKAKNSLNVLEHRILLLIKKITQPSERKSFIETAMREAKKICEQFDTAIDALRSPV